MGSPNIRDMAEAIGISPLAYDLMLAADPSDGDKTDDWIRETYREMIQPVDDTGERIDPALCA